MTLSIIGAGFGRTGTNSLKLALETIGFGPCYHMNEVFAKPPHVLLWQEIVSGKPVDWNSIFATYRSTLDWPACSYWRELSEYYPKAKVLLPVRDPSSWYKSMSATIYPELSQPPPSADTHLRVRHQMARQLILEQTFHDNFADQTFVLEVYRKHYEQVQDTISASRLLTYQVSEGWEPLCQFLGVENPGVDFPRINSKDEFRHKRSVSTPE